MTVVQTGVRNDVAQQFPFPTSKARRKSGDKYVKIGRDLLDLTKSKTKDDDAGATPNASGEVIFDVNSGLTEIAIDDLTFAQISGKPGGAAVTMTQWTPQTGLSLLEYENEAGGPFTLGETITGQSSAATAVVRGVSDDGRYLAVDTVSGTFEVGEEIAGGSSSATGDLTHPTEAALGDPLQAVQRFLFATVYDGTFTLITSGAQDFTWKAEGTGVPPS